MSFVESVDFGGRILTLETGKLAKQADGSVLARYGETVVLATAVSSRTARENQDFFPLTVDFLEKFYAAGRIPGGFFKREGMPPVSSALTARLIDRPCRPLFPEDYLADTQVTITVLSHDRVNDPGILGSIAASAALHISDIPFAGPIGTVRVACIDGEYFCNPTPDELLESRLDLLVSGTKSGVIMVEGSAQEISENEMMDALDFAHKEMQQLIELQDQLRMKAGAKAKREYEKPAQDPDLKSQMRERLWPLFAEGFRIKEKASRYKTLSEIKSSATTQFGLENAKTSTEKRRNKLVETYYSELKSAFARELTLSTKSRIDGRAFDAIRPISCEAGLLFRVHGSGLFTRGETQVLSSVTLGTKDDEQRIDALTGEYKKSFLLHYNFPPFSVGEARFLRPPGRREHGHGMLAERALSFVIPSKEEFPYTIRIVSEVLESNGSSSMATVCSGSMALMDAGVPIEKPVAGVAMGLIQEGEQVAILSDILEDEDHLGDMDFKVCGTEDGITAFQMDLKIAGVSGEVMEQALDQAREGRLHILSEMNKVISEPRTQTSSYAPRIYTLRVRPEKIREVIGPGGKVIRSIVEKCGVKMDVDNEGIIQIAASNEEAAKQAIEMINQIVAEAETGKIYEGPVRKIMEFGAFIEIMPGTDGLCHISELAHHRVHRVEDVVREGDVIKVKCLEVDDRGKIRLSRKALLPKEGPEDFERARPQRGHHDDEDDWQAEDDARDNDPFDDEDRSPRERHSCDDHRNQDRYREPDRGRDHRQSTGSGQERTRGGRGTGRRK